MTDQPAEFTVDVKGAGQGGLALGVDGPAETKINCKDNRDGTCSVDYKPTVPGDYNVTVKFADQHIPGKIQLHIAKIYYSISASRSSIGSSWICF